jgi:nucleotide-binding universal stress UspA family protein
MKIRTILSPIDFSELSARELAIAADVARAFGARLVLHHNRMAIAPGLARAWDWEATHHTENLGEARPSGGWPRRSPRCPQGSPPKA